MSRAISAVHEPWIIEPSDRKIQCVPNLSPHRHDPALVALGDAIRTFRVTKNISQEKLALMAGVDRSYFGRVERGDNNMAVLTLVKIAAALGITVAELMLAASL
jgi:DNA-binding XRE family transcriptional regulator